MFKRLRFIIVFFFDYYIFHYIAMDIYIQFIVIMLHYLIILKLNSKFQFLTYIYINNKNK